MKYLRKVCAVFVLTCAFVFSVSADGRCGEISCPGIAAPQPTVTAKGDMNYPLTEIAVSIITSVLSLS
jgi:hypothetical protein